MPSPRCFRSPKKKIIFRCGGEAAATKNIFFLLFWPRRRQVLEIFPPLL